MGPACVGNTAAPGPGAAWALGRVAARQEGRAALAPPENQEPSATLRNTRCTSRLTTHSHFAHGARAPSGTQGDADAPTWAAACSPEHVPEDCPPGVQSAGILQVITLDALTLEAASPGPGAAAGNQPRR